MNEMDNDFMKFQYDIRLWNNEILEWMNKEIKKTIDGVKKFCDDICNSENILCEVDVLSINFGTDEKPDMWCRLEISWDVEEIEIINTRLQQNIPIDNKDSRVIE